MGAGSVTRLLGSPYRQPFAPSFLTRGLPSEADVPLVLTTRAGPTQAAARDVCPHLVKHPTVTVGIGE